ncbi:telomere-associated protein Tap [Streptomyces sp. NPDC092903]|uniref:telomere-associated protein Tap n=1 Tax=Streptomyces sp. NPDC092903 TaxID=3366017 RepID=UPI00382F15B3
MPDSVEAVLARISMDGPVPPLPSTAGRAQLREDFGWTKTQLGEALGVSRETVWTWEKDPPRTPRGTKGQLYARILAYFEAELARAAVVVSMPPTVTALAAPPAPAVPPAVEPASEDLDPAAADDESMLTFDFEIEDPPELSWEPAAEAPMSAAVPEPKYDVSGSWTYLPEGATRSCVRCGKPTTCLVEGHPRHVYLEAMASMGVPRCGTQPAAEPAAPAPAAVGRPPETAPAQTTAAPIASALPASAQAATPATAPAASVPAPTRPPAAPRRRPNAPAPAPRRKAANGSAVKPVAPEHADGPLVVLDITNGALTAHLVDGRSVPCPAKTIQALAAWALDKKKIRLGADRLHDNGFHQDPLLVLTASAVAHFGLPTDLEDQEELRLPADHKVVKNITRAGWELTKSGFGPWPRVFQRLDGKRHCVQLAVIPWRALEVRAWGDAAELPAPELARLLGTFAQLIITPRGTVAVTAEELMTALRPPTKAEWSEEKNKYVSANVPDTLHTVVDPAPCEAPDEHPLVAADYPEEGSRPAGEALDEEACIWIRPFELITDDERGLPHVVALDVSVAFLAACRRLHVGTGPAIHRPRNPDFDPDLPGSWCLDLSHVELDPRLPSPFTPSGERPEGPAWYATPTVAYAVELGADVRPMEAWVRETHSPYLQPWYETLRAAYLTTMAGLGVTADLDDEEFLAAMAAYKDGDPTLVTLVNAIKATAKSGIGKLRQRPNMGLSHVFGEPWPALHRKTWRPDIRAMILSKARINMHRKMNNLARVAGRYPLAVNTDCVIYATEDLSPLPVLLGPDGQPVRGGFRLGVNPGSVKHQGSQTMAWALDLLADEVNIANEIKDVSLIRAA